MAGTGADLLRLQQRANCRRAGSGGNHHQNAYPQSVLKTRCRPPSGRGTTRAETAEDDGIWGMSSAGYYVGSGLHLYIIQCSPALRHQPPPD
ncbi:hypothetical protein OIU92_18855 [Escherichia coli]|nr:hypothetical protein [Escherichia coli]